MAAATIALTIGCAACSSSSSNSATGSGSGSNADATSQSPKYSLTLIQGVTGSDFYNTMACGAKAQAASMNATVTVTGADEFSASAQIPVVSAVQARRPNGVIIVPTDPKALAAPIEQLTSSGIKVVTADQKLADSTLVSSAIVSQDYLGGQQAAQVMAKLLGGKGVVLAISGVPSSGGTQLRAEGFAAEIKKYPGIDYLGLQYDQNESSTTASVVNATLSAHPDLNGIFAAALNEVVGASSALTANGKAGKVKIVGYDASAPEISALKAGTVSALIAQQPYKEGQDAVTELMNAINGKPVQPLVQTSLVTITPANVDDPSMKSVIYSTSC